MKIRTTKQLIKLVEKWQKILRLQDWELDVRMCRLKDIPNIESYAGITPNYDHKTANMYVLHPDDVEPNAFGDGNTERLVIHELMHLHTRPLIETPRQAFESRSQIDCEEQLIEIISKALHKLYYKKKS